MLEGLDDGQVRVGQAGVLADHGDGQARDSRLSHRSASVDFQWLRFMRSAPGRLSWAQMDSCAPWASMTRGTFQMLETRAC